MSIGDIMARHRPILPQRGSQLGSLGFSLKKAFKSVAKVAVKPLTATARVVAAPLKVSAAIAAKLPGAGGISTALNQGAGLVVGTTTNAPAALFKAPAAAPTGVVTSAGAQSPGTIETNTTPYNTSGTPPQTTSYQTPGIMSPTYQPLQLPVDSSGTPYIPQSMVAADAGPVLAPWYEQPLYLGGIAVAGFVGWKLWQRMKRKRR